MPGDIDWDLLASNPASFFGLSGEATQKDLKRAYIRWIKKFKPEQYPIEFQKLREAYEQVEVQLKYGALFPDAEHSEDAKDITLANPESVTSDTAVSTEQKNRHDDAQEPSDNSSKDVPEVSLDDLVNEWAVDFQQSYHELQKQPDKSPYHYYALACMSDIYNQSRESFYCHLADGLALDPEEPHLGALIHYYCQGTLCELTSDMKQAMLLRLAEVMTLGRYFAATESVWISLAGEVEFYAWREHLVHCVDNVQKAKFSNLRLRFFVSLAKGVAFYASLDWLKEVLAYANEHGDQILDYMEFELEVLELITIHRAQSHWGSHLFHDEIDGVIRAYCELPEKIARKKFQEYIHLAQSGRGVLEAFSTGVDYGATYRLLWMIASTYGLNTKPAYLLFQARSSVEALKKKSRRTVRFCLNRYINVSLGFLRMSAGPFLILLATWSFYVLVDSSWIKRAPIIEYGMYIMGGALLSLIVFIFMLVKTVVPKYIEPFCENIQERARERLYADLVRPLTFECFLKSGVDCETFFGLLEQEQDDLPLHLDYLVKTYEEDYAYWFLGQVNRMLPS